MFASCSGGREAISKIATKLGAPKTHTPASIMGNYKELRVRFERLQATIFCGQFDDDCPPVQRLQLSSLAPYGAPASRSSQLLSSDQPCPLFRFTLTERFSIDQNGISKDRTAKEYIPFRSRLFRNHVPTSQ
jgi:hypothetical protein